MQRRDFLWTPEYHFSKPESYQDQQRNFFDMQSPPEALSSPRWHWACRSAWCQSVFSQAGKSLDPLFSEGLFSFCVCVSLFLLFSAKENNSCVWVWASVTPIIINYHIERVAEADWPHGKCNWACSSKCFKEKWAKPRSWCLWLVTLCRLPLSTGLQLEPVFNE